MDNMKNIKELNLELIQLTDQVLLVDPSKPCQEGDWIYWNKRPVKSIDTTYSKATKYIITSTKQLEGLPLLFIQDEVDELIDKEMIKMGHEPSRVRHLIFGEDRQLAKAVYNKAKTTYKFTEEDLRQAVEDALDWFGGGRDRDLIDSHSFMDRYIQSLTQKELYVEVDCEYGDNCPSKGAYDKQYLCKIIPRITDNKIKAIWK